MNKNIKNELKRLHDSVEILKRKFENHEFMLKRMPNPEKNKIFLRNIYYFYSLNEKAKKRLSEVQFLKKKMKKSKISEKGKIKAEAKKNAIISIYLLKHMVDLGNSFDFEKVDFEVQTVARYKDLRDKIPKKYYKEFKQELEEIDFEFNEDIIENFALHGKIKKALNKVKDALKKATNFLNKIVKSITNIFKTLLKSMQAMFKMLINIGNFVLKFLFKFIKLFWKILKLVFILITKIIPKIIKSTWTFLKRLAIKSKKTIPITILLYFVINIALGKYLDLLLGDVEIQGFKSENSLPSQFIEYPSLFFTTHIFWTQTRLLTKIQKGIIYFILDSGRTFFKFFLNVILGIKDTKVFTKKMSSSRRVIEFFKFLRRNMLSLIIRSFIFIFVFKMGSKYFSTKFFTGGIPKIRDILLFPIIILKFILQLILKEKK